MKPVSMSFSDLGPEVLKRLNTLKDLGLTKICADDRNFTFAVSVENQDWIAKVFSNYTVNKHAMVLPSNILVHMSVEQSLEEIEESSSTYKKAIFDNIQDAEKWIIK